MGYDVRWGPEAAQELITLLADVASAQTIIQAAREIDRSLQEDPLAQGESRSYGGRVMFRPPLGTVDQIDMQQQRVRVLGVWRFRQHNTPE